MGTFDSLIGTSMKITDRLLEIRDLDLHEGCLSSFQDEIEQLLVRLTLFPKKDKDHEEFIKTVFPLVALMSISRESNPSA